ncbi:hypothetical protein L1987_04203 [Smallanthus sonchifolius]|uniref:Uncharacterized protein n=1 Tax=Smallanthus sonchifolius TaxID=185202 RepID=A0ACB9KCS1_9ASTR|nr:hypothetical protein L1987_04203 [Smallanthus sonchifolius]
MEPNSSSKEVIITVAGKETTGTPTPCRWNPTKEQIDLLETLYKQGVRTPTAEQIQEITSKLQTYGHIEGKNVFYWFQNHKARQRQKQKQDHLSYFHQYLHHHHHLPPPAAAIFPIPRHPNVLYGQCYIPQSEIGFYTQYPRMLVPSATPTKRRSPRTTKTKLSAGAGTLAEGNNPIKSKMVNGKNYSHQETLDLFPLHPTGILQQKEATANNVTVNASNAHTSGSSDRSQDRHFFDFFSS